MHACTQGGAPPHGQRDGEHTARAPALSRARPQTCLPSSGGCRPRRRRGSCQSARPSTASLCSAQRGTLRARASRRLSPRLSPTDRCCRRRRAANKCGSEPTDADARAGQPNKCRDSRTSYKCRAAEQVQGSRTSYKCRAAEHKCSQAPSRNTWSPSSRACTSSAPRRA